MDDCTNHWVFFCISDEGHRSGKDNQVESSLSVINLPWHRHDGKPDINQTSNKGFIDLTNTNKETVDQDYQTSQNVSIIDFSKQNLDTVSMKNDSSTGSVTQPYTKIQSTNDHCSLNSQVTDSRVAIRKSPAKNTAANQQNGTSSTPDIMINTDQEKRSAMLLMKARHTRLLKSRLMRDKKPKPYVNCKICGQRLENRNQIVQHSEFHQLMLQCSVCNASFASYCNLRRHCVGHVQTRLYKCCYCNCAYKRKDNLKTHMKKHANLQGAQTNKLQQYPTKPDNMVHSQINQCPLNNVSTEEPSSMSVAPVHVSNMASSSVNNREQTESHPSIPVQLSSAPSMESHIDLTMDADEPNSINASIEQPDIAAICDQMDKDKVSITESDVVNEAGDAGEAANQILNYTCSACSLSFSNICDLKKHIVSYHSDELDHSKQSSEHSAEGRQDLQTAKHPDTPISKSVLDTNVKIEDQYVPILDLQSDVPMSELQPPLPMSELQAPIPLSELHTHIQQAVASTENQHSDKDHNNTFSYMYSPVKTTTQPMSSKVHNVSKEPSLNIVNKKKFRKGINLVEGSPIICRLCGLIFRDIQSVFDHKECHPDLTPNCHSCLVCTLQLSSREGLRRHIKTHFGEEHQCHFCNSIYTRIDNLHTHMKNQHGWVKPNKYHRHST